MACCRPCFPVCSPSCALYLRLVNRILGMARPTRCSTSDGRPPELKKKVETVGHLLVCQRTSVQIHAKNRPLVADVVPIHGDIPWYAFRSVSASQRMASPLVWRSETDCVADLSKQGTLWDPCRVSRP